MLRELLRWEGICLPVSETDHHLWRRCNLISASPSTLARSPHNAQKNCKSTWNYHHIDSVLLAKEKERKPVARHQAIWMECCWLLSKQRNMEELMSILRELMVEYSTVVSGLSWWDNARDSHIFFFILPYKVYMSKCYLFRPFDRAEFLLEDSSSIRNFRLNHLIFYWWAHVRQRCWVNRISGRKKTCFLLMGFLNSTERNRIKLYYISS